MRSSYDFGSHTCLALARHMDELQARAKLASVRVSDDGATGEEQSALKARDLGVAFAHPDSPVRDQPSGMTLMSNSPDAFKGREIRVSHAAGVRFDDRTTNREEFPAHPVSPANYGNGVRKAYAPSPVKFEGTTTMREEYPAHPVSPTPTVAKKPYRMYEAKFDDRTTNREEFPAHPVSPANYGDGVRKAYAPSPVKFEGKTTNREEFPAHVIVAKRPPVGLWVENDRTEMRDLASQHPTRVKQMAEIWFDIARDQERLQGNHLLPVKKTLTPLSFRKDTSSGGVKN